jgi:hypothetical protein
VNATQPAVQENQNTILNGWLFHEHRKTLRIARMPIWVLASNI